MLDASDFERLRPIGLSPIIVSRLPADAPAPMRVTEVQREGLTLHDGASERGARLLPALRAALAAEDDAVAVGDWVLAERNTFGEWWVHERLRPVSQLARRLHDGRDKVTRVVIVSNVDTVLLVMGLDADFNLRRLERYTALTGLAGVAAVVVLTKADLCDDADARVAAAQRVVPAEVPVVALNGLDGSAPALLEPWLGEGQTLVCVGSSGAGKSTLTNALVGGEVQRIGGVRTGDGRGRHTTTVRSLFRTAGGACLIDTPGLRTLRLDGDAEALPTVFRDIGTLAQGCRFRDCRHQGEPGCAVRGAVSDERLRNYHKLEREAARDTMTALDRQRQRSIWKQRGRAGEARAKAKRA